MGESETDVEPGGVVHRYITYALGAQASGPSGEMIETDGYEEWIERRTLDGGVVEPIQGHQFARLRVRYHDPLPVADLGVTMDHFLLELADGSFLFAASESYHPEELQGRYGESLPGNHPVEGFVYFDVPVEAEPLFACFECSVEEGDGRPLLRWTLAQESQ